MRRFAAVVAEAGKAYVRNNGALFSGAIAFYAILSAAPLLVIALAMAGTVFGRDAARSALLRQLRGPLGPEAAATIETILEDVSTPAAGWLASSLGVLVMLWGASRLFSQLRAALNHTFGVERPPAEGFLHAAAMMIRSRALSFGLVLISGASLVLLLIARAIFGALVRALDHILPVTWLIEVGELAASTVALAGFLATVYRFLPDVRLAFRDVAMGSFATGFMLAIGAQGIGLYLGEVGISSAYGAAGSFVLILLWAYVSAQIFVFGAELTRAWAHAFGQGVIPRGKAIQKHESKSSIPPSPRSHHRA